MSRHHLARSQQSGQPGSVRLRWFIFMCSVLVAAIGTTVAVADRLDRIGRAGDQVVAAPGDDAGPATNPVTAPSGDGRPAPGRVLVTGAVTALHLDDATPEPTAVPTPLTVVSERGFGNGGELVGVKVSGKSSAIVWDGGRPFVLSSGPALVLHPVTVDLVAEDLHLGLGGGVYPLVPGPYRLDTPVAVGSSGMATPRASVSFEAADDAVFEAMGDAALLLEPTRDQHLVGSGRVHLEGRLMVLDSTGATRSAATFDLDRGVYDVFLTPSPAGGWMLRAVADAP